MPSILDKMSGTIIIDPSEQNRRITAQQRALKAQFRKDLLMKAEEFNHRHQPLPPEKLYAKIIRAGLAKIVRRRGKPPLLVWLR